MPPPAFEGRRVLISGGGTGIGRALARAFAEQGASVCIVGPYEPDLVTVAEAAPKQIDHVVCDITDGTGWIGVITDFAPHVLVNNAAVSMPTDLLAAGDESWRRIFAVNFEPVLRGSRTAARLMRANGYGRIANIGSIQGMLSERGSAAYGVAKAAVHQLTRCLAIELAPDGILVNAVAPGFVDTPMSRVGGRNELESEWFKTHYLESGRIPLGRPARPDEIAGAVLFLCAEGNTYITGHVLTVDGGLTATL